MTPEDLAGPAEAAALLGVKPNTIAQWRRRHAFPAPLVVLSRTPLWHKAELLAWNSSHSRKAGRPRKPRP